MQGKTVSIIILSLLVICMLALAFRIQPARSSPATITVPDDYSTIQAAVNAASPYDTILVRAGSYLENVTVNKNNLVIMGQYSHTSVVHGWFYLDTVANTTIANFTILGSGTDAGISFQESSFNTIRNNVISDWDCGFFFNYMNYTENPPHDPTSCHNNTVTENDISDCAEAIFFMEGLTNNRFYHNNFYTTIIDYVIPDTEFWDNGYPSGGNYWSGIPIVDEKCGPNQDQSGHDGINDTAYTAYVAYPELGGVDGVDHYPLVSPWSPPDIGVTNVTSSKTAIGQGGPFYINTTLENHGNKVEEFNLTVYANTTVIGYYMNIIFLVGNGTAVCTWDTTGFPHGNYTLSAYVWPVPGETDTADNNFTDGWVKVSIVGDLTGGTHNPWDFVPDGKVDGKDIAIVASCFGSAPGCPPPYMWNSNCDVNNDAKVDGKDIAIVAAHYGQAGP